MAFGKKKVSDVPVKQKAFKFRLYPNMEQQILINKTFGCTRFVYNKMLSDTMSNVFGVTPARYKAEFPFLKEVDSMALCNAQLALNAAYTRFNKEPKHQYSEKTKQRAARRKRELTTYDLEGYPNYKAKKHGKRSYTTNLVNGNIKLIDGHIVLPKLHAVKVKQHREIPEDYRLKSATVSQTSTGKYFVAILVEYDADIAMIEPKTIIGLDFSMHELYKDSDGNEPNFPHFYRKADEHLAREQRILSHRQYGSKRYYKQLLKVNLIHEKIANQRKDFLHKASRQITNDYDVVAIETLSMHGMAQALNFGKSVHDNGWGMFTGFMLYKLEDQGKYLVQVGKWFKSTQTCNVCGYINVELKDMSIREWTCPACGVYHDRDENAAVNIRDEGKRLMYMI